MRITLGAIGELNRQTEAYRARLRAAALALAREEGKPSVLTAGIVRRAVERWPYPSADEGD